MALTPYTQELLIHRRKCLESQLEEAGQDIVWAISALNNARTRRANLQAERASIMEDLDG